MEADLSSDMFVRLALMRRGLAFDQANLLDYLEHDRWVEKIFDSTGRIFQNQHAADYQCRPKAVCQTCRREQIWRPDHSHRPTTGCNF